MPCKHGDTKDSLPEKEGHSIDILTTDPFSLPSISSILVANPFRHLQSKPNRHQRRRDLQHTSLRRQQVKLRRRIPRVQHLDAHTQLLQTPSRGGRQRADLRARADNEYVCPYSIIRKASVSR